MSVLLNSGGSIPPSNSSEVRTPTKGLGGSPSTGILISFLCKTRAHKYFHGQTDTCDQAVHLPSGRTCKDAHGTILSLYRTGFRNMGSYTCTYRLFPGKQPGPYTPGNKEDIIAADGSMRTSDSSLHMEIQKKGSG